MGECSVTNCTVLEPHSASVAVEGQGSKCNINDSEFRSYFENSDVYVTQGGCLVAAHCRSISSSMSDTNTAYLIQDQYSVATLTDCSIVGFHCGISACLHSTVTVQNLKNEDIKSRALQLSSGATAQAMQSASLCGVQLLHKDTHA